MINYSLLSESLNFYETLGYQRIEAPWTVTTHIAKITKPSHIKTDQFAFRENEKTLVASGEQSFLYLYNKGFLPKGKFQTITPCFRSDAFDETHTKYFMKNELIDTKNVDEDHLHLMINDVLSFYNNYVESDMLSVVKTEIGFDIEYKGIELGSYGIRECSFLKWIYGTGLAEPRFSRVIGIYDDY